MTEDTDIIPIENIKEKKDGEIQVSASSTSSSIAVSVKTETQEQNKAETEIGSPPFLVFDDSYITGCDEDVEIISKDNVTNTGSDLSYDKGSVAYSSEDDLVPLVEEIGIHTTPSDSIPPSDESNVAHIDEFKTETVDISSELPLDCSSDYECVIKEEEPEDKTTKRKTICLEDESFANNFEGMYTCDTTVVTKRGDDPKVNERGNELKMLDSQFQCVNLHCQSGYGLEIAPVYALTYFGQPRKKNVLQKICKACFRKAFRHQQDVIYRLKAHKPVFKANFPCEKNDVVVMDAMEEKYEEELLPKEVITQVRKHLPGLLAETVQKYDIDFQMDEACHILGEKFMLLEGSSRLIDDELSSLEQTLREARLVIYKDFTPKIKSLPPLNIFETNVDPEAIHIRNAKKINSKTVSKCKGDFLSRDIVSVEEVEVPQKKLPPIGVLLFPTLTAGDQVYIMKTNFLGLWVKGRVIEVLARTPEQSPTYRVRYDLSHRGGVTKVVNGKYLSYSKPSSVRYPVGTRVIALYKNSESPCKSAFYVGLIAEPPKNLNKFRYLVFFDDGYAQYVSHEKILLVCESSKSVHEDIHPNSREFIKKYLEQYPERPMVRLMRGQVVRTEWNGKWWLARVVEVDCSLAKMYFDADGRTEWIYRGSTRLGPLYSELVASAARRKAGTPSRHRSLGIATLKKKNMPYVEYNIDHEELKTLGTVTAPKNVAKKSTNLKPNTQISSSQVTGSPNPNEAMEYQTKGYIRSINLSGRVKGKTFTPHQCGPPCTLWTRYSVSSCTGMSPLVIPLFFGFERQLVKHKGKRSVMYLAPCGRRLRTMIEVHRYLRITKTTMGLDYFDFDVVVHVLDEFHLEKKMYRLHLRDISYGLEKNPVTCVNEIDHSWPSFMDYSTSRVPQEGVEICVDEEFLVYCDCDDDCQDKGKCECWRLTMEGARPSPNAPLDMTLGYKHKRLLEPVTTGIFECNHRCKCSATCLNRVAQHPLQLNLQVFRTLKKGWGLRTINDIPQGTFICIYAGRLHTEQSANEFLLRNAKDGRMYGDEYLAELDYIEVVERFKEGYESVVVEPKDENEDKRKSKKVGDKDCIPEDMKKLPQTQNPTGSRARKKKILTDETPKEEIKRVKEEKEEMEYEEVKKEENKELKREEDQEGERGENKELKKENDKEEKQYVGREGNQVNNEAGAFGGKKELKEELEEEDKDKKTGDVSDNEERRIRKRKSLREMFGDTVDDCYIMDAKTIGNIGRYLNHSCQPNVFVQNVFVDCHDVRFPWVAFFALTLIKAGTELTWDYNYDIGSVPDKVLYCYCNKPECRGRLL